MEGNATGGGRNVPRISEEARLRYEAKARVEAWDRALQILKPWVASTRAIGSEELRRVMMVALDEAQEQYNNALAEYRRAHSVE
jgi:hypothetical protein